MPITLYVSSSAPVTTPIAKYDYSSHFGYKPHPNNLYDLSSGDWNTERDACDALDALLYARRDLFHVRKEVEGVNTGRRPGDVDKGFRIDRVLLPTAAAQAQGWSLGAVGIECKKSQTKIGPPIAQCLDYRGATWFDSATGIWITLGWVFLWPVVPQHGPLGSVMAQNRVGTASVSSGPSSHLTLNAGGSEVVGIHHDRLRIGPGARSGLKVGSR